MMKYVLNHDYKFASVFWAWLPGFLQAIIIFQVEIVNVRVIL